MEEEKRNAINTNEATEEAFLENLNHLLREQSRSLEFIENLYFLKMEQKNARDDIEKLRS
jgi:hypothetical protein